MARERKWATFLNQDGGPTALADARRPLTEASTPDPLEMRTLPERVQKSWTTRVAA